jgi:hypothetical protein
LTLDALKLIEHKVIKNVMVTPDACEGKLSFKESMACQYVIFGFINGLSILILAKSS